MSTLHNDGVLHEDGEYIFEMIILDRHTGIADLMYSRPDDEYLVIKHEELNNPHPLNNKKLTSTWYLKLFIICGCCSK